MSCSAVRLGAIIGALCVSWTPGCYLAHERELDAAIDVRSRDMGVVASTPLVWVLVHPTNAPLGPGLFLFDEARQAIIRRLPLPDGVTSPHALAWDGRSLWLGGVDAEPGIREIDPADGRVLSRWAFAVTEGIAIDGDTLWYAAVISTLIPLVHVAGDGTTLESITLPEVTVQDLVMADGALYYLVDDDADRIMRFDPATRSSTELVRNVDVAPYSLGFDGAHLAVAVDGRIRRYDPSTGALESDRPFAVPGWITAIAFVR